MFQYVLCRYYGAEKRGKNQKKGRGRRPSFFDMSYDPTDYIDVEVVQEKATPVQNVYFFKKGTSGHHSIRMNLKHIYAKVSKVHFGRAEG